MGFVYTVHRSTWKTVYRPFGSIGFHAAAGIPAFRVQRVKRLSVLVTAFHDRPLNRPKNDGATYTDAGYDVRK